MFVKAEKSLTGVPKLFFTYSFHCHMQKNTDLAVSLLIL